MSDDILEDIINSNELSIPDKLNLFVSMVDAETLKKEIMFKATMIEMGLDTKNKTTSFALAILRIGRPEVFTT